MMDRLIDTVMDWFGDTAVGEILVLCVLVGLAVGGWLLGMAILVPIVGAIFPALVQPMGIVPTLLVMILVAILTRG